MAKKDDFLDYFDDYELEAWGEEVIEELWDDEYGEFYELTDEEKADAIRSKLNDDDWRYRLVFICPKPHLTCNILVNPDI